MSDIDLRSDTVTLPTADMLRAMTSAPLGDDVFGDDPTVNRLEETAAERMGKEAALFVASGTMGNLLGLLVSARPGQEVIADADSHLFLNEAAGAAMVGESRSGKCGRSGAYSARRRSWPRSAPPTMITSRCQLPS
jgi:threonine aldolase